MKEGLDFCKYYATENINLKLLYKAAEDCDLNMGEMIYIDIISQNKPSCGDSNNYILLQISDTGQNFLS